MNDKFYNASEAEKIICRSALTAMSTSLVPILIVEELALVTINLKLINRLSKLYGVEFKEDIARNIIISMTGVVTSILGAGIIGSAVLAVLPGIGLPLSIFSASSWFGCCTYAMGHMFINHFEQGGDFLNANLDVMTKDFKTAFQSSREWLAGKIRGGNAAQPESR